MFLVLLALVVVALVAATGAGGSRGRGPVVGVVVALALGFVLVMGLMGARGERVEPPEVTIVGPLDDTTVANPVKIEVVVKRASSSHPHVMVDEPCLRKGKTVPADAAHLHLGAEREWTLDLLAGKHTLCAQMGDRQHRALSAIDRVNFVVK